MTPQLQGTAIIDFSSTDDALAAAVELNRKMLVIDQVLCMPRLFSGPREPSKKEEACMTVFIGNFSWDVVELTIREIFRERGEIVGFCLCIDRESGNFTGYGHSDFLRWRTRLSLWQSAEIIGRQVGADYSNWKSNNFGGRGG